MTRIIPRTRNTMQGRPAFICGGASDFALTGLYLPIRCSGCYRTEVISRRETFSLLSVWMLLAGCGQNAGAKPDLPAVGVAGMEARRRSTGRLRLRGFRPRARRSAGRRSMRDRVRLRCGRAGIRSARMLSRPRSGRARRHRRSSFRKGLIWCWCGGIMLRRRISRRWCGRLKRLRRRSRMRLAASRANDSATWKAQYLHASPNNGALTLSDAT